jgi:hypothetical protein
MASRLEPTEDLLDQLALSLADSEAFMPIGSPVHAFDPHIDPWCDVGFYP